MKTKLSMWIAVDRFGYAARYSIASLRGDAIEKATQCMMGANAKPATVRVTPNARH